MLKIRAVLGSALLSLLAVAPGAQAQTVDFHAMAQDAVKKSVPLLQKTAAAWPERSGGACWSCHNQGLPAMAVGLVQKQGFAIDKEGQQSQAQFIYRFFAEAKDLLRQGLTNQQARLKLIDPPMVLGYGLADLAASQWPADETTGAMARFLAHLQLPDGHWAVPAPRPPLEVSEFTATALGVQGLQTYMPGEFAKERDTRIARAKAWLLATKPRTTEDRAFRLFGLSWSKAGSKEIRKAVQELLAEQHDDGGWSQLADLKSDAYATGQVLVALHQAGGLPASDAAYMRGFLYLVGTQKEDGSWLVQSRTTPFQPYFESGFPHEKSQFISCAGSSWATMALALAAPAETAPAPTRAARAIER